MAETYLIFMFLNLSRSVTAIYNYLVCEGVP